MSDDDDDLQEIDFVFDGETIDLPPSGAVKNPMGDSMDKLVNGTLFRAEFLQERQQYRVSSYTPVEGFTEPLILKTLIERRDARSFAESNFIKGYSTDTAALQVGIERLTPDIALQVRKLREDELVGAELEAIEGFGSF